MADNFAATPGSGATFGMDEVIDGTLGTVKVGFGKIMDGTLDSTNKLIVNASGEALVKNTTGNTSLASIDGKITAVNTGAVVVSSSALPSGASTAAKQPALGTAGTASADVITVQGKALMTPILIDGSATTQPVSGTVTADTELPAAAALADTTANPTVPGVGTYLMGWDGTGAVWDRLKQQGLNADAQTAHAKGVLETASNGYVFNGTTWDRAKGDATNGAFVNVKTSVLPTGAATSALQTQPGVDIGDVTINNAAGASAVNIQDGGNSITVDGTVGVSGSVAVTGPVTDTQLRASNVGVALNSLLFPASTNNSSTAQLAASATFTGTIETVQNLQAAQIQIFSDQPFTLNIDQFIDAGGTKLTSTDTFTRLANVPFNENVTLPGNYFRIRVQNTGASTTTTLQIDTTFGIMATGPRTVTTLGNNRSAINEINGTAVDSNSGNKSAGTMRVVLATDQPALTNKLLVTPDSVALPANQSVNVSQINAVTPLMGNGVTGTGSQRVTIASDNTAFSVNSTLSAETTKVIGVTRTADGSGNLITSSTNSLDVNLKTSTITLPVSLASVPSHAVTNAGTFAVQTSATSTGGYTPGKLVSAATTNATVIKASAGTLGHISASNVNAAARYVKFYNKATTPTVGTDVPVLTYIIPGNTAGAGTNIPLPPQGINFSTGISFATTVEATDAGSTGVAASEIIINYGFN